MAWTKNFTLPTNFNNNNQFDTSSVLTPDMFNVPYQNTLYLKDHLDIVEGELSNIDNSLYNLGAYDTITANSDGTYTITRQTGYFTIEAQNIIRTFTSGGSKVFVADTNIILPNAVTDWNQEFGTSNIGYKVISIDGNWIGNKSIGGIGGQSVRIANNDFTTIDQFKALCPINIQYKMTTSYTEKVEKNHYSAYNKDFILEHNKSEAERSCNLLNTFDRSNIPTTSSLYNATLNSDGSYTSTTTNDSRAWTYANSDFKLHLSKGTYYFSVTGTISTNNYTQMQIFDTSDNTLLIVNSMNEYKESFTLTSDTDVGIEVKSFDSSNLKLMLNIGSIALPYQEYEGKIVHLKDLELYGTKPAIANVQCPIDLSKWNDDTLSHSSGSSVPNLWFDYDALGYIYLLPTSSSGSMTKGIVRYTGGDTDAFTWSISAITKNYIELSCATKFFLDGPASSRGTLKTANYVLEIEDMYGHTFSLPFSVNYKV